MRIPPLYSPDETGFKPSEYVMGQQRGMSQVVCGVYVITCLRNGKQYVGSSDNIPNRWRVHRTRLDRGIHPSELMIEDWDTFGEVSFTFRVLERVIRGPAGDHLDALMEAEQRWIDKLRPAYNTLTEAGSSSGYKHTDEAKEKMRYAKTRRRF